MTQLQIQANSVDTHESVSAYSGICRPLSCAIESRDGMDVLTTQHESPALFGPVYVPGAEGGNWLADNDGQGFVKGDNKPIDFRREACKTRIQQVQELANTLENEGMPASNCATQLLDEARSLFKTEHIDTAIEKVFWAGEKLVEDEVTWRLTKKCRLDLGINTKGLHNARGAWDKHFASRFNYATIPTTWGILEMEKDTPRYDVLDELVEWGKNHGIRMKAHALIWHANNWGEKKWLKDLRYQEVLERSLKRTRSILGRIGQDLDAVELINEPLQANCMGFTPEQQIDETIQVYQACKEIAPHLRIMISFYGEDEWWFAKKNCGNPNVVPMAGYIDACIERGVQLDLIGLQYHFPDNFFNVRQVCAYWHSRYNVPIHITELTPSSGSKPSRTIEGRPYKPHSTGWRGRSWSEEIQAEYVRDWLKIFRGLPFVENATFWATTDAPILWHDYLIDTSGESYRLPWAAGQGLLREDLSPKRALYEVK